MTSSRPWATDDAGHWLVFRAQHYHQYLEALRQYGCALAEVIESADEDRPGSDAALWDAVRTADETLQACHRWIRLIASSEMVKSSRDTYRKIRELVPELDGERPSRRVARDRIPKLRDLPHDDLIRYARADLGLD